MSSGRSIAFVAGVIAALAIPIGPGGPLCSAESPAADVEDQAQKLVRQLGSPSFRQRQRASSELAQLGLAAKDALLAGLANPDAEVRFRCQRALTRVLELDYRRRLAAFTSDPDPSHSHGLGGWERFRQTAGDDPAGRGLFVAMHEAEPALMESAASGAQRASEALAERCQQLQETLHGDKFGRRKEVPLGSVAAVVFVAGDAEVAVGDQMANYLSNFMFQGPFQTALEQGDKKAILKKMLGAWIGRTLGSPHAFHALVLSLRHDLKEGLAPALKMTAQRAVPPHMLLYAMLTIGKFGGQEHLVALAPLLEDTSVCTTAQVNNQQLQIEVRDVALAVLVHLSGQDFKEYGLTRLEKNPQLLFNPGSLSFADAAARDQALARWRAWHDAQPKPTDE